MAKPIFTVGVPKDVTEETLKELGGFLGKKFDDYHVLVYPNKKDKVKFECFFEKDFNEVKFEELKEIIKKCFSDES